MEDKTNPMSHNKPRMPISTTPLKSVLRNIPMTNSNIKTDKKSPM